MQHKHDQSLMKKGGAEKANGFCDGADRWMVYSRITWMLRNLAQEGHCRSDRDQARERK